MARADFCDLARCRTPSEPFTNLLYAQVNLRHGVNRHTGIDGGLIMEKTVWKRRKLSRGHANRGGDLLDNHGAVSRPRRVLRFALHSYPDTPPIPWML